MFPNRVSFCGLFLLLAFSIHAAELPTPPKAEGLQPGDKKLSEPIGTSKEYELTIASFNIRNLAGNKRRLKDFAVLADLIDEADVVLVQEVGLGLYDKDEDVSAKEAKYLEAIVNNFKLFLEEGWVVESAPNPSGSGKGIETKSLLTERRHWDSESIIAGIDMLILVTNETWLSSA